MVPFIDVGMTRHDTLGVGLIGKQGPRPQASYGVAVAQTVSMGRRNCTPTMLICVGRLIDRHLHAEMVNMFLLHVHVSKNMYI